MTKTDEQQRVTTLERANKELRRADAILRKASALLAMAEAPDPEPGDR